MQFTENVMPYGFMQQERPVLGAKLEGNDGYPELNGSVYVYCLPGRIYLQGDFSGLPLSSEFAFHIHEGTECGKFGKVLLPLPDISSGGDGNASMQVCLDRADCTQIAGRTIVLHLRSNGEEIQIACGVLERIL